MLLCMLEDGYDGFSNEDVRLFFFDKDMSVRLLDIEPNAQILLWPAGFFDQAERDAATILKLGIQNSI